nr:fatty acid synthase-like [Leptinotarsa decemlineata]
MKYTGNIVISGISGRFPECENVEQFKEALFQGVDLISEDDRRYPAGLAGTPRRLGKIPEIKKFDAAFFGIHPTQADFSDPRQRLSLEAAYECIIDAGFNPTEVRGSKTGVYFAIANFTCLEEIRKQETRGYSNIGLCLAIAANRLSYCFDFKGPSYALDSTSSGGLYAMLNAVKDIRNGIVDSALVCSSHLILDPEVTVEYMNMNVLSPEGKSKVFSADRNGYVRSETIACYFLQKESDCRRMYATVLGAHGLSEGFKKGEEIYPSGEEQLRLLKEAYAAANLSASDVAYIEAFGLGTVVGDSQECYALSKFCEGRKTPLHIGSVKSNMGMSDTASGLASLTKIILAMEVGVIPANLHTQNIDMTLPGISDNKLKVVTENLPWKGGIVGCNAFGLLGTNAHVILKSNEIKKKPKIGQRPKNRLFIASGRNPEAISHFFQGVMKHQDDDEFAALVDEIHRTNIEGHQVRGYMVVGDRVVTEIEKFKMKNRPVWFIYSGMGSQWTSMGKDIMNNKIFRNTFMRCAEALKPYDIDLEAIVTNDSPELFDNILNCFIAITAIQIGLTDVLFALGIRPDGFAGHSMGEVGCGYCDGTFTPEEAILISYARGLASVSKKLPPGLMAAIGLSKEETEKLLPDDIFVACHNSAQSVTISGPKSSVEDFVKKLSDQGIFAKLVKSGGIAYHTKYLHSIGQVMLDFCNKVFPNPKPRSSKWVSTSITGEHQPWMDYNCAQYHYNNFMNPVHFNDVYQKIPDGALVIEIAPHGLLQSILKRALGPETINLSLLNRSAEDNEQFFLTAIGKMYLAWEQPNLRNLYPGVTFPVSRGTPMLSPLVKWDHAITWFTTAWTHEDYFGNIVTVNLSNEKYSYLEGHNIDGRVLMPATGYLEVVWEVLAKMLMKSIEELPVVMENVKFKRATVLLPDEDVHFLVNIVKQSGYFEIFEGGSIVVTGSVKVPENVHAEFSKIKPEIAHEDGYSKMSKEDLYKECHLRRYMYKGIFRGITECDIQGVHAKIEWNGKYTSFMDAMIHTSIVVSDSRALALPTSLRRIVIDPISHSEIVGRNNELPLESNRYCGIVRAGGIEIMGLRTTKAPRRQQIQSDPCHETMDFIYYTSPLNKQLNLDTSLRIALQIVIQNTAGLCKSLKICQTGQLSTEIDLQATIKGILDKQVLCLSQYSLQEPAPSCQNQFDIVVTGEGFKLDEVVLNSLTDTGFILWIGTIPDELADELIEIFQGGSDSAAVQLLRRKRELPKDRHIIKVSNNELSWLKELQELYDKEDTVYLISEGEPTSGIVGLTTCLLAEPTNLSFRCVFIDQEDVVFSMEDEIHRNQLEKNLTFNVLRNNNWGTFVHLPLGEIKPVETDNASISLESLGDLSSIKWVQRPEPVPFHGCNNQPLVHVYYSALNFRDIMVATGKIYFDDKNPTTPEVNIGLEYSGVTSSGKRVMGIVGAEGMALQVRAHPTLLWDVPKTWSLEEAATVPVVYATCYYGMILRGKIKKGESILIHAGAGGIGIAAISIALSLEAKVFTTVSTQEKKDCIMKMFPSLEDKNIGNSRDKSFEKLIMTETKGKGVDLVLNSLAADLYQASIRCIARRGRFLEIGKVDAVNDTPIDYSVFLKNRSFHGVHLDGIFASENEEAKKIQALLQEGIEKGVVKPLPSTVYNDHGVESAFRFLSSGKHKGKVLIQMREEDANQLLTRTIPASPKVYFDCNKSYILVGGLGGFGLELANWMIRRGATKIILNSRRQIWNGYQALRLKYWSSLPGITVKVNTNDSSDLDGAKRLILDAEKLGPVGGNFNMALVLRDAIFSNQTEKNFEDVFKAKISSGFNLDTVTRQHCPNLDIFVVFSSVACGRGNAGQTNYGMANSALERLCEKRKRENLPGLAIQWGPIGDVGILANVDLENTGLMGMLPQNITSCLNSLETFMLQDSPVGSSIVLAENEESSGAVKKTIAETVAHILGVRDIKLVDKSSTISQLGMDSLMVTEIKQTLYRNFHLDLSIDEIRLLTFEYLLGLEENNTKAS